MRSHTSSLFICSVVICSLFVSLTSCSNKPLKLGEKLSESEMEQLVNELNSNCPIDYRLLTATNYKCEGKTIVIEYVVNEDKIVYNNLTDKTLYNIWRLCCLDEVSQNDKDIIKSIVASGYDVKCLFKGSMSQKKMSLDVSNDKLKNNKPLTEEDIIANLVKIDSHSLPRQVDSVTRIVDFKLEKDKIIYCYEIDDTSFDISQIENDGNYKKNGKNVIGNELRNNTLTGVLYKLVARSGRGIVHQYTGNTTGKVVEIQFSNAELRQIATVNGVN